MRIATWNINSIRARADRALAVLERHALDVLLLQETKCKPEQFPVAPFEDAGYEVAAAGLNQWNGVAIVSRAGLENVTVGFKGQPGFAKIGDDGEPVSAPVVEARAIGAQLAGALASPEPPVEVWSLYVPNGRSVDDAHYAYKLDFLARLREAMAARVAANPEARILLAGDWNVAPLDSDVWDRAAFGDGLYVSGPEREAFNAFGGAGFVEVTRNATGADYTFWDYQRLRFARNEGMRIDFAWASPALAPLVVAAEIDREERKGKGASDHVPVIAEFDA